MFCSKSKYATEKFALDDIARIKAKSKRIKVPVAAYLCKCGFWHLTSQPNKDARIKELEVLVEKKKLEVANLIGELLKQSAIIQKLQNSTNKEIRADERIILLRQQIADLNKKNHRLRQDNNDLIAKLAQK